MNLPGVKHFASKVIKGYKGYKTGGVVTIPNDSAMDDDDGAPLDPIPTPKKRPTPGPSRPPQKAPAPPTSKGP